MLTAQKARELRDAPYTLEEIHALIEMKAYINRASSIRGIIEADRLTVNVAKALRDGGFAVIIEGYTRDGKPAVTISWEEANDPL